MIGAVLGSYRIVSKIGAGGMGMVYVAEHAALGRRVAIKVLLPELSRNATMIARMFAEARAAAQIQHPGLVTVHDFGQLPDGSAFIVMELLDGETLAARLDRRRRFTVEDVVSIGRQVATAVGAVHQRGIVHRDLKPDNIFLVADPEVAGGTRAKVLDFGIAKLSDGAPHSVRTQTGALMGTPAYMSPEQCRGAGTVDARSDIYALGCILFEMLTGQPPFNYEGMGEVIAAHMYGEPPTVSSRVPDVPPWLETVVMRTLAKRPEDRPQTMEELAAHLGGARISVRPQAVTQNSFPLIAVSPTPTAIGPPRRRRRGVLVALLGSAVITAGTMAVIKAQEAEPKPTPEVAAGKAPPAPAPAPAPAPVPVAPTPAPVAAPAPAPAPVAAAPVPPETVKLRLVSQPSGAEVYRAADGIQLGETPYEQELPRAAGKAVFIVKLEGYREQRVELPIDRDGEVAVTLGKASTRTRPATGRRARSADSPIDPFAP